MTSAELVPVGLQTPCSVGRGWLEGARAGPAKVRSRAGALHVQVYGAGHRTHIRDTNWSRTRNLDQALDVEDQETGADQGLMLSPSRRWEISTERTLKVEIMIRAPGGGHGNPLQYSCLENSLDRKAWQATVQRIRYFQPQK